MNYTLLVWQCTLAETTLKSIEEKYCWPKLKRDVKNFLRKCQICQTYKGQSKYVFILYYQFPNDHRHIFQWTSFQVYHEHKEVQILFLQLLTDSLKQLILFYAKNQMIQVKQLIFSLRKLFVSIEFLNLSHLIEILYLFVTFNEHYGKDLTYF